MDAACPERLVAVERDDHGRDPGTQAGGGRAGAAVVDRGGRARQQPGVRDALDHVHARRRCIGEQPCPTAVDDRAHAGSLDGVEHQRRRRGGVLGAHAAEADVDGRRTRREEGLQVGDGLYNISQTHGSARIQLTGNEALAFGFLVGGGRFFTGYPITPATDILDWLQKWIPKFGGIARQAEDELAAINMALGAALTGVRSMTATSGPGLALMQEGVSQSGSGEIPLVIVDTQRGGPSTGMPTKPEQSDINLMCFGGNGDFPRIVVAPGSVQDCFEIGIQATNLAEQLQVPVYVAMDQGTCQNLATIEPFDLDTVQIDRGPRLTQEQIDALTSYGRYAITDDGVSPYTIPGQAHGMSLVTGNERFPDGTVTTQPANRLQMVAKRTRKIELAASAGRLPSSKLWGDPNAEIGVIGVGGAYGPILEAVERLQAQGIPIAYHQPRTLWPVMADTLAFIESRTHVFVVELNATAQIAKLFIREGAASDKMSHVLRYDGEPFRPNDIVAPVSEYHQGSRA